jgi:hypothetical protein
MTSAWPTSHHRYNSQGFSNIIKMMSVAMPKAPRVNVHSYHLIGEDAFQ